TAIVHAAAPDAVVLRLRDGRQVVWGDGSRADEKAVAAQALLRLPGARYDISSPGVVVRQ
ncbi:MAG: cell division protein FtsQ, partial [Actinomycetota bacterium]|nr:cell division protein FtsQ [Actinomycetota bacterium]